MLTLRLGEQAIVWSPEWQNTVALDTAGTELWLEACDGVSLQILDYPDFLLLLARQGVINHTRSQDVLGAGRSVPRSRVTDESTPMPI